MTTLSPRRLVAPSPRPIDLILTSFVPDQSLASTDATPWTITMEDSRGREYILRFRVRNIFTALVDRAVKRLVPIKRIRQR